MTAPNFTTLQLAEILATAARASSERGAAQAIILTLHACDSWFCRVREDDSGTTVDEPYEGQQELFA